MPSKQRPKIETSGNFQRPRKIPAEPQRQPVSTSAAPGTLFIVATPIGNLADITLRALEVLRTVDWIAAEDTRHTRKLLSYYDIHKPLVSYHTHNARQREPELLSRLATGLSGALVSDAGTPGISDPGALLLTAVLARELPVEVLPGPAAFLTALVASGLPAHPFAFVGFPPSRGMGRKRFFALHAGLPMTLVLYESPQRLLKTLGDILTTWGDRRIAVARELTKFHEEVFRGMVSGALEHFGRGVRGEVTVVVAPVEAAAKDLGQESDAEADWRRDLAALLEQPAQTVKTAAQYMADHYQLPRRLVYQEALLIRAGHR